MHADLEQLLDDQRNVATSGQILAVISRRAFEAELRIGSLERIWQGIYCRGEPDDLLRLRGLDLSCGTKVAACMSTAAALHGFDTEGPPDLHVLNPPRCRLRSADGLVVHRRDGAPLVMVGERRATSPAWTAVEVARSVRRPRALATLDAALRSGTCSSSRCLAGRPRAGWAPRHRRGQESHPAGRSARRVADGERGSTGDDRRRPADT